MKASLNDSLFVASHNDGLDEFPREITGVELDDGFAQWRATFATKLVGDSAVMMDLLDDVRSAADTDCTVLIMGETGTGKEVIASLFHRASSRAEQPFVPLNCAAIPESLIESELFGHTKGAFTGALSVREGRIAAASGGTLFLDEIGDMPLAAQAKLLRVLQEGCLTPVGSDKSIPVDIRVVAATNRNLEEMVDAGTFRADLFFRLSVVQMELPPLRDRGEDIVTLAKHFLAQCNKDMGRAVEGFDASALKALKAHAWKGNVRELAHTIQRAVVFRKSGTIGAVDLSFSGKRQAPRLRSVDGPEFEQDDLNLKKAVEKVEEKLITMALDRTGGNRTEAATLLGLNRTTLVERLRKIKG